MTIATILELAAALILPVIVIAIGRSDWVLPSIVITIGPLLLYLDHLVDIPRYRVVGWVLTAGPVILIATLSGSALAVTTGIAAGVLLLGTATAGFHDLANIRPARPPRPARLREDPMTMPGARFPTGRLPALLQIPPPASGSSTPPSAQVNNGQLVRFKWRSVPGGVITEHIHPHQEERFTIVAGEAHFTLGGERRVARAGETITVPAGVRHSEGNPGPGEIEGIVELRPALHTKEWHEALAGLVADGKTTPRGAPKNPLQLGATFWHFRQESRVTSPPIWTQNLMLPPPVGAGEALRHPALLRPLGKPNPRCRMSLRRTTRQRVWRRACQRSARRRNHGTTA